MGKLNTEQVEVLHKYGLMPIDATILDILNYSGSQYFLEIVKRVGYAASTTISLSKLQEQGLVDGPDQKKHNPKKPYTITVEGAKKLKEISTTKTDSQQ